MSDKMIFVEWDGSEFVVKCFDVGPLITKPARACAKGVLANLACYPYKKEDVCKR